MVSSNQLLHYYTKVISDQYLNTVSLFGIMHWQLEAIQDRAVHIIFIQSIAANATNKFSSVHWSRRAPVNIVDVCLYGTSYIMWR